MRYAKQTQVPVERSRAALQKTIEQYGGDNYSYGCSNSEGKAIVGFTCERYRVKIIFPIPKKANYQSDLRFQKDTRQAFRVFLLVLKAKLESVSCGIQTFEQEFFSHLVMENGGTVYENMFGKSNLKLLSAGDQQ